MPLGVGKRMQKVWGRLVWYWLSSEGVSLWPRRVIMVLMARQNSLFWDFQSGIDLKDGSDNVGHF
jgi:hypothetical protein